VTSTDARKLECIQQKFAALCQNHFSNASGTYEDFLKNLKLHTLCDRRHFPDALFLSSVYCGLNAARLFCTLPVLEYLYAISGTALFFATSKNSLTTRCVLAANLVFNDTDFFTNPITLLQQTLN
jgi:hypothetical protein